MGPVGLSTGPDGSESRSMTKTAMAGKDNIYNIAMSAYCPNVNYVEILNASASLQRFIPFARLSANINAAPSFRNSMDRGE